MPSSHAALVFPVETVAVTNFGKLRRRTERGRTAIEYFVALVGSLIAARCLIRRACTVYRWGGW